MRVLVIGGGGREHALVWKIAQSPLTGGRRDLLCVPGNPGIASLATCLPAPAGGLSDVAGLADLASEHRPDLTVIGPEQPLTLGLADELARRGLAAFGPSRAAARLEGSKAFAKRFMARHRIPTAPFVVFDSAREALKSISDPGRAYPVVIKADGLAAGKGVIVAADRAEAEAAVRDIMERRSFGAAGDEIVVEDCLQGVEVSFFAFTDGERVVPLNSCQDYKRALEGDRGANTGGMGAYGPSIEVDASLRAEILDRIIAPTVRGLAAEGCPYRGVLYAGLMLVPDASGGPPRPMVLEYNVRFGDPEAQVLMPLIAGDVVPVLLAVAQGRLDGVEAGLDWRPGWSACVVVASRGYPGTSESGRPIDGLEEASQVPGTVVFHAGTRQAGPSPGGGPRVVTAGGRALAVCSVGPTLAEAIDRAYRGVGLIRFEGMQYRRDIGRAAVTRLEQRARGARGR